MIFLGRFNVPNLIFSKLLSSRIIFGQILISPFPTHPTQSHASEPCTKHLPHNTREGTGCREERMEMRRCPMRDPRHDNPVDILQHLLPPLPGLWRFLRDQPSQVSRIHPRHHRPALVTPCASHLVLTHRSSTVSR